MGKSLQHRDLDALAVKMFQTFSRFEYALKAAGLHTARAEPDWRRFAGTVVELFDQPNSEQLAEAIEFLIQHPPKKQVILNGRLDWSDIPPTANSHADRVLQYVRRVRNNLFHGGKFNGHWFAPDRSEPLLRHSLTVLDACLEASENVRRAYFG